MEQVRRVMSPEMGLGILEKSFGLIADHLTHDHRQRGQLGPQRLIPSSRIPPRLIALQDQEVGHGFDPHQADLRMKRFIQGHTDDARGHVCSQPLMFFLAEGDQQRLHLLGKGLLSPIGRGDEFIQAAQFQEPTQVTDSAVVALHEGQVRSRQQLPQDLQAFRAFQEPHCIGRPLAVPQPSPSAADPVTQGALGDSEYPRDFATGNPGGIEPFKLFAGFRSDHPRRNGRLLAGHDKRKMSAGIHGWALLGGLPITIEGPSLDTVKKLALLAFRGCRRASLRQSFLPAAVRGPSEYRQQFPPTAPPVSGQVCPNSGTRWRLFCIQQGSQTLANLVINVRC